MSSAPSFGIGRTILASPSLAYDPCGACSARPMSACQILTSSWTIRARTYSFPSVLACINNLGWSPVRSSSTPVC
jgi:hypothetical protein